ncbi:hypothetical protein Cgig2_032930 [Carnegiea gigantea]|uniref:Uncharacterized protein n=1 Tax=Carnegiea gigantea TaxID=171969 RepID=A0A9Q1GJQ8_9CARY|nr:hypothetical protein Cgig2_032930 [Carnegiea gigantea]
MLVGSYSSGFGYDPQTKSVVAEKEVWKAYVECAMLASLCLNCFDIGSASRNKVIQNHLIGVLCQSAVNKDRALGKDAQGPKGMKDEVNEEGENEESSKKDEPESLSIQEPSRVEVSSRKSGNLGKRVRAFDNLVKGLSEVVSILRTEISVASRNISRAIDFDVELSEKRSKLNEEFANLGLISMERH